MNSAGETIRSGRSQSVEPNVIRPGEVAIAYVYAGPDRLPQDGRLSDPAIDYTQGLGEFENIVTVDVTELEVDSKRATGTLKNPHSIVVTGPISVSIACLSSEGQLTTVYSTFADREQIEPGGSSTFTVDRYDDHACRGQLAGASGYTEEF